MKKTTAMSLWHLAGLIVGGFAIIAVICSVSMLIVFGGEIFHFSHRPQLLTIFGIFGAATLLLCGLTAMLLHKAHLVEAALSQAEQSKLMEKRQNISRIENVLFWYGYAGMIALAYAGVDIYILCKNPGIASKASLGFWLGLLFDVVFGTVMLSQCGIALRTKNAVAVSASPSNASIASDASASDPTTNGS